MIKIAVVTGCASFLGTAFTTKLLENGWYVYGIDKLTYVANDNIVKEFENRYSKFKLIIEDICNIKWLPECDVIFNFAAESDVDNGNKNCKNFIHSNIDGVRNLLEIVNSRIVTKANKPLFFQISTDEVYGDLVSGTFDENSNLNPSNPYAATKASADLLIKTWARRTWTHSEDTADALLILFERAERNKVYNISSEYEQSNFDTVRKIINSYFLGTIKREIPDIEKHIDFSHNRPGQDVRYAISCNPLRTLQWRPHKVFDSEITKLVENYKKGFIW